MSLWKSFKNLSPKARAGVGAGLLAWGTVGLFLSDKAEKKFGYTPTQADKDALPRISTVERRDGMVGKTARKVNGELLTQFSS